MSLYSPKRNFIRSYNLNNKYEVIEMLRDFTNMNYLTPDGRPIAVFMHSSHVLDIEFEENEKCPN